MTTEKNIAVSLSLQPISHALDEYFVKVAGERIAFVLVVAADDVSQYVSNVSREDGTALLLALFDRWKSGRADIPAHYNPDLPS